MTIHQPFGYRVSVAVELTSVSRTTIHRMIKDGLIPDVKWRGRRIIPASVVETLMASRNGVSRSLPKPASKTGAFRARLRGGKRPRPCLR